MVTCKQFLRDLNDYLDETLDPQIRSELQRHVNECPNCWVVCDTTEKTLKVFKGMEPHSIPNDIETRLWAALEEKCKAKRPKGTATSEA